MSKKTQELCHKWFQGKEEKGYIKANGYRQMAFWGNVLYTYNVALAMKDPKKEKLIINTETYSNTSSEHYRQVLTACQYKSENIIKVNGDVEELNPINEIKDAIFKIKRIIDKQSRARSIYYLDGIDEISSNLYKLFDYLRDEDRTLAKNVKLPRKNHPLNNQLQKFLDLAIRMKTEKNYASILAEKKKLEEKFKTDLEKENFKEKNKKHREWYAGSLTEPENLKKNISVYLKIVDGYLLTNSGVRIDLLPCILLYKKWKKGEDIIGLKLEEYTVLESSKEEVKIGCTTISAHELDRVIGGYIDEI